MTTVDCVLDARARIGEGAIWSEAEQVLWWVDITAGILHRFDPATGRNRAWPMPCEIGCFGLRRDGSLIIALRTGYAFFDPDTATLTPLHDPEPERPDNRFNDGTVDPAGRLWAGTMALPHAGPAPVGSLYRLDPDLTATRVVEGMWTPNGMAFSPDGRTMYLSDSYPQIRTIWAFDYDVAEGRMGERRIFVDTHGLPGRPDGGTIDADGCYWMAGIGGWQLMRFTPAGRLDRVIDMPVERPTKVAFGGPKLDVLYVTSSAEGVTPGTEERQPRAGGLFAVDAGVTGWPIPLFAG